MADSCIINVVMHEINNVNKRLRAIKNFSNYFLMGIVVALLTFIIVLAAAGYDIDRNTGQVIQNGIVLVESQPDDASVIINGNRETSVTPAKYPIPEGEYSIEIQKAGYRTWRDNVQVKGSQVTWLYYPVLIPEVINTTVVDTLASVRIYDYNTQSDRLVIARGGNVRSLLLYDLSGNTVSATPYAIPDTAFRRSGGTPQGNVSHNNTSPNGRYMVLDYTGGFKDYIVVDLNDRANSFNVDARFGRNFDSVYVADDTLYLVADGRLFATDVRSSNLGTAIASGVTEVIPRLGASPLFIANQAEDDFYLATVANPSNRIIELSAGADVQAGTWDGDEFFAVLEQDSLKIYRGPLATEPVPEKIIQMSDGIQSFSVAPSGRFVAVHANEFSSIYDLDNKRTYQVDRGAEDSIGWLDGYRLAYNIDDSLYVSSFDGSNENQIVAYDDAYPAIMDANSRAIYTISVTAVSGNLALRQSGMIVESE